MRIDAGAVDVRFVRSERGTGAVGGCAVRGDNSRDSEDVLSLRGLLGGDDRRRRGGGDGDGGGMSELQENVLRAVQSWVAWGNGVRRVSEIA